MKQKLLDLLVCPDCRWPLKLDVEKSLGEEIIEGILTCACTNVYRITKGVPRFACFDKYVNSFSFEWDVFAETLLDSKNDERFSADFFRRHRIGTLDFLKNKLVLDVGCGMGHFMEIAASVGAEVVGIDLSFVVDSAFRLIGSLPNVHIIQADIFSLPFKNGTFDFIYSFGVLHHTPDCKKAFSVLPSLLKKGGEISICV